DVSVVGAGPAGAICAHNLGARGYSVLLVDREDRGRFHIGESLIPYVVELWAQEGIGDDVAAGPFIHKPGVQIDDRQVDRTFVFDFTQPQPNRRNYAYNVERADDGYQVVSAHDEGWVWCIPIGPRALSVGTVTHASKVKGEDRDALFEEHLRRVPIIAEAVDGASSRYDKIKVQSDFCYHSE